MAINYDIVKNNLTTPPSYGATPAPLNVLDWRAVAALINSRQPIVTPAMAEIVLRSFADIVSYQLVAGNKVTLENFISFYLSIRGRFPNSRFSIRSGQLGINGTLDTDLKQEIKDSATYSRNDYSIKVPVLTEGFETNSSVQGWLNPGSGFHIYGNNMKYDFLVEDEGIFILFPTGTIVKQTNVSLNSAANMILLPILDPLFGPAGSAGVESSVGISTRYTPGGTLRHGQLSHKARSTNYVSSTTSNQLFVTGVDSFGPCRVRDYQGAQKFCSIVSRIDTFGALFLSVTDFPGDPGIEVLIPDEGIFSFGEVAPVELEVTDYDLLYQSTEAYAKYLNEMTDLSPISWELIDSAYNLLPLASPVGTGLIWDDTCSNTQIVALPGDRFVWIGYKPNRETQTLIGSVDAAGVVTFGSLVDLEFLPFSFEHNTFGLMALSGNYFARYHEDTGAGFAVWDAGSSGLSATMVNSNDSTVTCTPSGYKNGILFSHGIISMITDSRSLCIYLISGDTVINETEFPFEIWGANRDTALPVAIDGCAYSQGVIYAVRTADLDQTSNPQMEFARFRNIDGDLSRGQCADLDGHPIAIACQETDNVFVVAYTVEGTGELRIRCGSLVANSFVFGDSFDFDSSLSPLTIISGTGLSLGDNRFVIVIQLEDSLGEEIQSVFPIYSDGSVIYSIGDRGQYPGQPIGGLPVGSFVTDVSKTVCIANYGNVLTPEYPLAESRYITTFEVTPVNYANLVDGVWYPIIPVPANQYNFARIKVEAGALLLNVSILGNTSPVTLYVMEGDWPSATRYDCTSVGGFCVPAAPGAGYWYIMLTAEIQSPYILSAEITYV